MNHAEVPPEFHDRVSDDGSQFLYGVQLAEVPEWLGNLTALTRLSLGGNQLAEVPESLGNLTALSQLNLGGNRLASVPGWLGNLTALTTLDLSPNLSALTTLNLSGNQLTAVPLPLADLLDSGRELAPEGSPLGEPFQLHPPSW